MMCRKQISLILILVFAFNFAQTQYKAESHISYYPEKISKTEAVFLKKDFSEEVAFDELKISKLVDKSVCRMFFLSENEDYNIHDIRSKNNLKILVIYCWQNYFEYNFSSG